MVNDKVANIEDLERNNTAAYISDLPFDVTSEQVKFPLNLDQSPFATSPIIPETVVEASNSS